MTERLVMTARELRIGLLNGEVGGASKVLTPTGARQLIDWLEHYDKETGVRMRSLSIDQARVVKVLREVAGEQ